MIIHTETRPGLIGELHLNWLDGNVWFHIMLRERGDGPSIDSIDQRELPDAVAALSAGMKGGNFDRYRAEERHRRAVENDTLDQY